MVKRIVGQRDARKGGHPVGAPEHHACRDAAQMRHRHDAAAVAAKCMMDPILHPDMRQEIEREGDVALPPMRDARAAQLRQQVEQMPVQPARADPHIRVAGSPAAE